jgi:hypothetical protein
MALDTTSTPTKQDEEPQAKVINEQLICSLTGKTISASEAYWAPPLITTRQLVSTVLDTLVRSPGMLGQVLMAEQPNVPYAQEARDELARRRSAEQLKLLLGLLVLVAIILAPILLFMM